MKIIAYKYHLTSIFFLFLVLVFFYFPVLFLGKTLQAPEMVRMNQHLKAAPTPEAILYQKVDPQIFNIELASAAYNYFPQDVLVGHIYKNSNLPLWNPYQALGAPLAAGYETAAFFPLRILQDILPLSTRDWFFILEIWMAGIFTYYFFINTNLNRISSFFGATLYMGSGIFSWYFQLNNYLSIAMLLPLLLIITHLHAVKNSRKYIFPLALVSALILYAGQPEAAFYTFVLSGCYFIYKIFSVNHKNKLIHFLRYSAGFLLGFLIASPLLLLFQEFLKHSFNSHIGYYDGGAPTITANTQHTRLYAFKGILFPKLLDWANMPVPTSVGEAWDLIGGYIGILAFYFISLCCFLKNHLYKKDAIFFLIYGSTILLLNFGIWPFRFIGSLPIFDVTMCEKFAGATWDFALTATATYGFYFLQTTPLSSEALKKIIKPTLIFISIFLYLTLNLANTFFYSWALNVADLYQANAQIIICAIFTIALLSLVTYYLLNYRHTMNGWIACLLTLIVELQFIIPKGNFILPFLNALHLKTNYLLTQIIFLIVALLLLFAIFIYVKGKRFSAIFLGLILVLTTIFLTQYASPGYPKYENVTQPTPFIRYLQKETHYNRIFGLEGILDPFYSSVYGLFDIRIVAALSVKTYQNFIQNYVMLPTISPLSQTFVTHFLFLPFDKNPDHVVKFRNTLRNALNLLSVKYIIAPNKPNEDWAAKFYPDLINNTQLVYSDHFVNIYKNENALPRVFLVDHYQMAKNYQEAQAITMSSNFDSKNIAVLEEPISKPTEIGSLNSAAKIENFSYNNVLIQVTSNKFALLVFTDIYFPGWHATIDGNPTKIYRVDGLFRGVFVTPGNHVVKFDYAPKEFRLGIILMITALFIAIGISITRKKP